jgi:signal transduction histidine kinase
MLHEAGLAMERGRNTATLMAVAKMAQAEPQLGHTGIPAALPENEAERVAALHRYGVLDTLPEQMFDDIAQLAASICETPIALISLVDSRRQWFKARVGLEAPQTARDLAFCAHAILRPDEVMVVSDATSDQRFAGNALVTGDPKIRFYAGAPVVTSAGHALGTVCAIDRKARTLTSSQQEALRTLARQTARLLEYRSLTEARHASLAQELSKRRERLIQLAATSTSSLDLQLFVDREQICRYANDTYLRYWAVGREAVEGVHLRALMSGADYDGQLRPQVDRALAGEQSSFEGAFDYPGLGRRYVNVTFLPALEEDGAVVGAVIRVSDIHGLKQTQDQLRHAVEELDARNLAQQRFIYMISHDVREPVNTICNFSGLLERDCAGALGPNGQQYLAFVSKGGQRIRTLLDDLLLFVRLEGKPGEFSDVDLNTIADDVISDLTQAISQAGAQVGRQPLPRLRADPTLMRLLLQNLLSNAIKFHRPGARPVVELTATVDADTCSVTIHDNGVGIPAGQLGQLFGVFKRLHSQKKYPGTGLGLAICKQIAELHGGQIAVESTLQEGSRFTVTLPGGAW